MKRTLILCSALFALAALHWTLVVSIALGWLTTFCGSARISLSAGSHSPW